MNRPTDLWARVLSCCSAFTLFACSRPPIGDADHPELAPATARAHDSSVPLVFAPAVAEETAPPVSSEVSPPPLPDGAEPGVVTRVPIPGYRSAFVVHGAAGVTRAMVYLHGVCGNVDKVRDWTDVASHHVTTIAIYGNKPCPTSSSRFSWNQDVELIHQLIQSALTQVAEARDGQLDVSRVIVFGYSQGASRAERLAERYPERYPWVILGGPPATPRLEQLRGLQRLAILVGSEERQEHLADVAAAFTASGLPTHFDVFAGAVHGVFGRSAPVVMDRTLRWLLEEHQ